MPFRILNTQRSVLARKHQGFSLIEVIFSVAISGILAASVVTTVYGHAQAIQAENSVDVNTPLQPTGIASDISSTSLSSLNLDGLDSAAWQKQIDSISAQTELKIVQTGIDIMMINSNIKNVSPTLETNDMSNFPVGNPLYPKLVRERYSKYSYKCNSSGEVTQIVATDLQVSN